MTGPIRPDDAGPLPAGVEWTFEFPHEWLDASGPAGPTGWLHVEVLATCPVSMGEAILAGGVRQDGTNLCGLVWPGGARYARASPDHDWRTEERYAGNPPASTDRERLDELWRIYLEQSIKATREMKEQGLA